MVTQLQPDVRAYLHGAEVIKRYIRVEAVSYTHLDVYKRQQHWLRNARTMQKRAAEASH